MPNSWSLEEVEKHNSQSSCWVIINDHVYDVTEFLPDHPGGKAIILKYGGKDATAAYEPIHPAGALDNNLPPEKRLGNLDTKGVKHLHEARSNRRKTKDEVLVEQAVKNKPPLGQILNLQGLEDVARSIISYKTDAYYSSAADDQITHTENIRGFSRIFFNPRVLRAVSQCDPSTKILGYGSSIPVFVSGSALAKLGHPLGEVNITRGAGRTGIIQMVSSNASLSPAEIADSRVTPDQPLFFQLYKKRDSAVALKKIREIESLNYKAIFLTVDAIVAGNRERDIRASFDLDKQERKITQKLDPVEDLEGDDADVGLGTAGALVANDDSDMTWEKTIPWLRQVTKLPIVVKGIQSVADAVLAAEIGVDGIVISNHGGRQLDYSLPSIEVLYRLRKERSDVFDKLEVYMDGGARRGTDVLKAVCLGAKAVGMGRPFMYAQSAYGEAGVIKAVRILEREILTGMRLLGAKTVSELVPEMVEQVNWQPQLPTPKL